MAPIDDPGAWVKLLLGNPVVCRQSCRSRFKQFDKNKSGFLEWSEIVYLCHDLAEYLGTCVPDQTKLRLIFDACAKTSPGRLKENEFEVFFEHLLRSMSPSLLQPAGRPQDRSARPMASSASVDSYNGSLTGSIRSAQPSTIGTSIRSTQSYDGQRNVLIGSIKTKVGVRTQRQESAPTPVSAANPPVVILTAQQNPKSYVVAPKAKPEIVRRQNGDLVQERQAASQAHASGSIVPSSFPRVPSLGTERPLVGIRKFGSFPTKRPALSADLNNVDTVDRQGAGPVVAKRLSPRTINRDRTTNRDTDETLSVDTSRTKPLTPISPTKPLTPVSPTKPLTPVSPTTLTPKIKLTPKIIDVEVAYGKSAEVPSMEPSPPRINDVAPVESQFGDAVDVRLPTPSINESATVARKQSVEAAPTTMPAPRTVVERQFVEAIPAAPPTPKVSEVSSVVLGLSVEAIPAALPTPKNEVTSVVLGQSVETVPAALATPKNKETSVVERQVVEAAFPEALPAPRTNDSPVVEMPFAEPVSEALPTPSTNDNSPVVETQPVEAASEALPTPNTNDDTPVAQTSFVEAAFSEALPALQINKGTLVVETQPVEAVSEALPTSQIIGDTLVETQCVEAVPEVLPTPNTNDDTPVAQTSFVEAAFSEASPTPRTDEGTLVVETQPVEPVFEALPTSQLYEDTIVVETSTQCVEVVPASLPASKTYEESIVLERQPAEAVPSTLGVHSIVSELPVVENAHQAPTDLVSPYIPTGLPVVCARRLDFHIGDEAEVFHENTWWIVTLIDRNPDHSFSVEVHDGYGTQWRSVHPSLLHPKVTYVGDEVLVLHGGNWWTVTLLAMNPDGTFAGHVQDGHGTYWASIDPCVMRRINKFPSLAASRHPQEIRGTSSASDGSPGGFHRQFSAETAVTDAPSVAESTLVLDAAMAMTEEPEQIGFSGSWMKGSIVGNVLTWRSGHASHVKFSSPTTVTLRLGSNHAGEGVTVTGELSEGGTLRWDDHDVWEPLSDVSTSSSCCFDFEPLARIIFDVPKRCNAHV